MYAYVRYTLLVTAVMHPVVLLTGAHYHRNDVYRCLQRSSSKARAAWTVFWLDVMQTGRWQPAQCQGDECGQLI
jgi:hypothetical protein